MNYTEFIARIGHDLVVPGDEYSIDFWLRYRPQDSNIRVLDLACSLGYVSRYISSNYKNITSVGIDISKQSIAKAKEISKNKLSFLVQNACSLEFKENEFQYIIAGLSFSFISPRESALLECVRTLKSNGFLCIANLFYVSEPPKVILSEVNRILGLNIQSSWGYDYHFNYLNKYFVLYKEEILDFSTDTLENIEKKAIDKFCYLPDKEDIPNSLLLKRYINENHKHLMVALQLWKPRLRTG